MLKKAGILVAATAAGLLALSPLAFATDDDGDYSVRTESVRTESVRTDDDRQVNRIEGDGASEQTGLVNVGDVQVVDDTNVCPAVPVNAGVGNLLGVLGGGSSTNGDASAACVNDESVEQVNVED